MRKISLIIFLLALPLVCFGQDATTKATPKQAEQSLQLTIKSDKLVYEVGEEIKLTFIFRNNSTKDISFCRFLLKYNLLKRNIKLQEQGGYIYKVFDRVQLEMPSITKEDFIILHPNDEYALELQLKTILPQDSTLVYLLYEGMRELPLGIYEITATYENNVNHFFGNEVKDGMPNKIPVENTWTGTLASNTITVEVVNKRDAPKGISKEEAIEIAKQAYEKEGKPADQYKITRVDEYLDKWEIKTSFDGLIRIDKKTGAVLGKFYMHFGGIYPPE